jgi:hypothetical protein
MMGLLDDNPYLDSFSDAVKWMAATPDRLRQQTYDYMIAQGRPPEQAAASANNVGGSAGRTAGVMDMMIPQSPADVALLAAGPLGGVGTRAGKAALTAGGGLLGMESSEAEAGVGGAGRRGGRNIVKRAADALAPNPRAQIGGNMPPEPIVTPDGFAIQGKPFSQASKKALDEIKNGPPGAGPIDLNNPNAGQTPQASLMRYNPPRGMSPRMERALNNPDVEQGIRDSINRGVQMGADKWYHTDALRQAWIDELGPVVGPQEFTKYMDYVAATSPRSDVSSNIRNASYYYMNDGKQLPEKLPYPYGHVAQNLHRQNADVIQNGGFDIYKNPKPASFSENLQGNLAPVTVDTHAFRNIGMRTRDPEFLETSISVPYKSGKAAAGLDEDQQALLTMAQRYGEITPDGKKVIFRPQQLHAEGRLSMDDAMGIPSFWASKPRANEYGASEQLWKRIGDSMGMQPADAQGAGWAGAGDLTGLKSPPTKTFPQLFNERVQYTSQMRGEDPTDTLRMMILKQKPLLSVAPFAGGAALAPGLLGGDEQGGMY